MSTFLLRYATISYLAYEEWSQVVLTARSIVPNYELTPRATVHAPPHIHMFGSVPHVSTRKIYV